MIATDLILNDNLEEELIRPVEGFPHTTYYEEMRRFPGGFVPWHWHPDVEFLWVMQGLYQVNTEHHSLEVHAGEGVFINSNVLHQYKESLRAPESPEPIALFQVFDALQLLGGYKSIIEEKYIQPILACSDLEVLVFQPSVSHHRQLIELLKHSYDAAEQREFGYEFAVRNDFSSIWALLYKESETFLQARKQISRTGGNRIKKMMLFIQKHYSERLTLEQIAAVASISPRECLRCFNDHLHTTPFSYLLDYRVRQAARLLRETDNTITEIAYACGFFGTSYFSKMFKRDMNCTPSQYRKAQKNEDK